MEKGLIGTGHCKAFLLFHKNSTEFVREFKNIFIKFFDEIKISTHKRRINF